MVVVLCLALNWLGDSLDGTLARFRDHSRPRYGFYVDHIVDAFSAFFLLGGLALSGYMSPAVALGLLLAYLMLSVEIYLATYALGDFKISYYKMGPTELRILLSIGNLAVLWRSTVHLFGRAHRLFDVAGTLGISGMLLIMVISAVRNTIRLYREEPIPVGKPQYTREPATFFRRLYICTVSHLYECLGKRGATLRAIIQAEACHPIIPLRNSILIGVWATCRTSIARLLAR